MTHLLPWKDALVRNSVTTGIVAELVQTPDPDLVAEALTRTWNRPMAARTARAAVIRRHSFDDLVPRWGILLERALADRRRPSIEEEKTS